MEMTMSCAECGGPHEVQECIQMWRRRLAHRRSRLVRLQELEAPEQIVAKEKELVAAARTRVQALAN